MLPQAFVDEISRYSELAPLASALLLPPEVSVRVNSGKGASVPPSAQAVPWCPSGFYLADRPQFTFDPALHQGRYYVQDASSMAICTVVSELSVLLGHAPIAYLDACAAPGGKTTAAMSVLSEGSWTLANEYDFKRAEILAENVAKWGAGHVVMSRGNTSRLRKLREAFDIVAVDAPCSGEGMMRKDAQAVDQWSPALVAQCADTQREILENVWQSLRPGGFLIYSTCTFNRRENEENLQWLCSELGAVPVPIAALESHPEICHGIETDLPCYRFLPGRVKGEGLFLAVVRKPGAWSPAQGRQSSGTAKRSKKEDPSLAVCRSWLSRPDDWSLSVVGEEVYALPVACAAAMSQAIQALDCIMPGLHVATVKGRDVIPAQELALSDALNPEAFPTYDLPYPEAIAYLQRQAIAVDAPKGYVLLTYQGRPLGWAKNLGNRANNLYPKPWRIISQQVPDAPVSVITSI